MKGQSVTTLHCETSQGKRFPVNSLFLRMRGFLRNGQKARGMGLSGEQVVEHPSVLTIFPVDFPDTGNFRQRRVRSRLAPPPTSLLTFSVFSAWRRIALIPATLATSIPRNPAPREAISLLRGPFLCGPVAESSSNLTPSSYLDCQLDREL